MLSIWSELYIQGDSYLYIGFLDLSRHLPNLLQEVPWLSTPPLLMQHHVGSCYVLLEHPTDILTTEFRRDD